MNTQEEFSLQTDDGLSLYAHSWLPSGGLNGVVALIHGIGEHVNRYAHLAAALNQAGFALYGYDQRGHGKSPGKRGHVPTYDALLDDVGLFCNEIGHRHPDVPLFLYGHSMGGNIVLNYVMKRNPALAGVVASAPSLRLAFEPPALKVALGRMMNHIWPAFTQPSGLDTKALSRDMQVVRRYEADPLVHDKVSARLFVGFFEAGFWALDHAAEISLPLLILHGSEDALTSAEASRQFAASVGENCTLKIWEGLYHEIHNEPEQDQVFALTIEWLQTQASVS